MSDIDGAAASAEHDELWYVQMATDDVRTMTLEQLDEAFQAGTISAQTYVCQVGSSQWETLADVAGLEADEAPASAAQPVAPIAFDLPATAPAFPSGMATFPAGAITGVHAVTSDNPFLTPPSGPQLFDMPEHLNALSTAPVATEVGDMDVDVDVQPSEFRPRRSRAVLWVGGLASVAAIALGVVRLRKPAPVEFPPMPPGAALAPEPQVDLVAAALAAAPPVVAPVAPAAASDARLGDDTKKALAEADKSLAVKQKAKQKARQETRSAAASPRRRVKSDQPFHKGGNRYDPLNSSL